MEYLKTVYDSDSEDLVQTAAVPSEKEKKLIVAPYVHETIVKEHGNYIESTDKEVFVNLKYDELYAPDVGPENPFKTDREKLNRNTYHGQVEETFLNSKMFDTQRINFSLHGVAFDPSITNNENKLVYKTVDTEIDPKLDFRKRKREPRGDPADVENFKGPWADYVGINRESKPTQEQLDFFEEARIQRMKRRAEADCEHPFTFDKRHDYDEHGVPSTANETSMLHLKNPYDYQGRSFVHIPVDTDTDLRREQPPAECFQPKKLSHTWKAHAKGVSVMKLFPTSGHLILSGGFDSKIKLWQSYGDKQLVMTYEGHKEAVKDLCFNNNGTQFLSCSYDRWVKLWDTETGKCIQRFTSNKIPCCIKFNPDEDKQNLFIAGMINFKMLTWDIRDNQIVQEYDRHLGPVNTITFFDNNRRIITTSDDKSIRVWEWDIPVDTKYIADPSMHAIAAVTMSPDTQWLVGQAMNSRLVIYDLFNRVRERRRAFKGHETAGYACQPCFSPDGKYLVSGDGNGKVNIWTWEKSKLICRFEAHKKVAISCAWLPHEQSKLITAGWDGFIKLWS